MLKVKTFLAPSTISNIGIGLFADERIEKDTVIWEFVYMLDFVVTKEDYAELKPMEREFVSKYAYFDKDHNGYIMCVDNARFFNHSETPNTYEEDGVSIRPHGRTVASRIIEQGEELFCNYFDFDEKAKEKL